MTVKEFDDDRKSKDTERDAFRKERLERQKLGEEFVTETIYLSYTNPADVEKMLKSPVVLEQLEQPEEGEVFYQNLETSLRCHGITLLSYGIQKKMLRV